MSAIPEIDTLVAGATKALAAYATFTQADVDYIVKKAAVAALDQHAALADLAVRETGRGGVRGQGREEHLRVRERDPLDVEPQDRRHHQP